MKFHQSHWIGLITLLLATPQLSAQIATDGTLGAKINLSGPDFQITPDLGLQQGSNLFHSFEVFNLKATESATFTGPAEIENILTRVTGDQRSFIDGTLRSEIPNANLYLLNPNGFIFGEHAKLDIQGSFYVSTAKGIKLGDTDTEGFLATPSPDELNNSFFTASPSAFGFLDSPGATIEIVAGDTLEIRNSTFYAPNGQINVTKNRGELQMTDSTFFAPHGQVNITINGSLQISQSSLLKLYDPLRQIDLDGDGNPETVGNVDVSGQGGGRIFIQAAGQFVSNGWLFADVKTNVAESNKETDNFGIDIQVTGRLELNNGALITADNYGENPGVTSLSKLVVSNSVDTMKNFLNLTANLTSMKG